MLEAPTAPAPVVAAPAPAAAAPAKPDASVVDPAKNGAASAAPAAPGSKPPAGADITSAKKEANPANPDKPFKIVADGKEYNVSEDELKKLASKGLGADKRFNEASRVKQQVESFLTTLKTDPMKILMNPKIGLDFKKLAQEFLVKEIEREQMTPEQRELEEAREKIRQGEEEKKTAKEKEDAAVMERLTKEEETKYQKDIISTLDAEKLPKTRWIVQRIAYYLSEGLRLGHDLKAAEVVPFVRKDMNSNITEMFNTLDGDALAEMLGDANLKKLNEAQLKKMKGGNLPGKPAGADPVKLGLPPADDGKPVEKLTKTEWRKRMETTY